MDLEVHHTNIQDTAHENDFPIRPLRPILTVNATVEIAKTTCIGRYFFRMSPTLFNSTRYPISTM
jgi:hypothetical protein